MKFVPLYNVKYNLKLLGFTGARNSNFSESVGREREDSPRASGWADRRAGGTEGTVKGASRPSDCATRVPCCGGAGG